MNVKEAGHKIGQITQFNLYKVQKLAKRTCGVGVRIEVTFGDIGDSVWSRAQGRFPAVVTWIVHLMELFLGMCF